MKDDTVYVHADESCLGNQYGHRRRPGAAAGLVEVWADDTWVPRDYWASEPDTTNNRMAIRSALEALGALRRRCTVHLVSDSQYLVRGIAEWLPAWKRRGWKRRGGPPENLDLWKRLDGMLAKHDVRPRWVRGHAGHPRNEYANHLAVRAAKEQSSSGGLVDSGLVAWLEEQRAAGRYFDFMEFVPPELPDDEGG